jgi:hypothetical protein
MDVRELLGKIGVLAGLLFLGAALMAAVLAGAVVLLVPIFLM